MPRRAGAIVGASVAGALVVLGLALSALARHPDHSVADWATVGVLATFACWTWVRPVMMYRPTGSEALNLDEGFFVAMALLLPAELTVIGFAAATLAGQSIRRRPLVKSVFNAGQTVTAVGVGLVADRAVAIAGHPLHPWQVGGAVLGAAAFFVVNAGSVGAVLAALGSPWRSSLLDGIGPRLALAGAGCLVGAFAALAVSMHPWALALGAPLLLLLRFIVAGHFEARHDRSRLRGLLETTLDAHRQRTPGAVEQSIVHSARLLLRCAKAEVRVERPGREELGAPIDAGGAGQWLVVSERNQGEAFDGADRDLVETFAAVCSAALTNAGLQEQMHRHAFYDPLTGLANRRLLVDHLEHALRRGARQSNFHAVLFADVDRFKSVNDSLGHNAGDQLLVEVAQRLRSRLRTSDILARFGGDEFVVLLEDTCGVTDAVAVAAAIRDALRDPVRLPDGHEVVVTMSVGITVARPGQASDDVLREADVAMYQAKGLGRCGMHHVYDSVAMGSRSTARLDTETELRKALERGELDLYYQPFFATDTGRLVGAEALVRWNHPTRGLLLPGDFIEIAEESGLIIPLGRFVLEHACRRAQLATERLGVEVAISVNLPARQFQQRHLAQEVRVALAASGLKPSQLVLEITETVVMEQVSQALETLGELKELGLTLAIDDFGTGYSSLGYLKHFPVDQVKIDRSFVIGLGADPVDEAIARSVVDLADAIGITTVAEGVETPEQLECLRALGCPTVQGFLLSPPLPADAFEALLDEHLSPGPGAGSGGRLGQGRPDGLDVTLHLGREVIGVGEADLATKVGHEVDLGGLAV